MKKFFSQATLILWSCIFINSAIAVEKKYGGKGDLYLSKKMISDYFSYVTQPSNKIPLVFFITKDEKNFYSTIINNDGGGYAESNTIKKKKIKCEKKFKQECNLFSNMTFIVWDNSKNPLNENVSIIDRKTSRENLILKLVELGFIIDKKKVAIKKVKELKKKAAKKLEIAKEKVTKEEKVVKEKKIKKDKDNEKEKIEKRLSLIPSETELEIAQNFLNNLQQFIKLYPDVFDIVKVSEFFILTKSILDGNLNYKLEEDLKKFKEFTNSSEKFVKYNNDVETKKRNKKLKKIDEAILELKSYVKSIKGFMIDNPNSIYLEKWLINFKIANETLDSPESYEKLISINDSLKKIINEKNELDSVIAELKYTIDELKENFKVNLTTDLAPLIIEQIKFSDQAIKSEKIKNIISANKVSKDFIFKKIEEPKLKAAEEKRLAEEKVAVEKRLAEEKARQEYLKTPEGQKEEKERKQKEKKRLAEEKRLKNFKPISMMCTYSGQGGIKTYKWVFDGKNINWEGMNLEVGGEIDDGNGMTISTKKLEGRDNFQIDAVMGFLPMTFKVNFGERSSVMKTMGISIYGTCI